MALTDVCVDRLRDGSTGDGDRGCSADACAASVEKLLRLLMLMLMQRRGVLRLLLYDIMLLNRLHGHSCRIKF